MCMYVYACVCAHVCICVKGTMASFACLCGGHSPGLTEGPTCTWSIWAEVNTSGAFSL
jgi:hypothetical protein